MQSDAVAAAAVKDIARRSRVGEEFELPGPVGERNLYALRPRGRIALQARTPTGLRIQPVPLLATGNSAVVSTYAVLTGLVGLPEIGTASCRDRWCKYAKISAVADTIKKK